MALASANLHGHIDNLEALVAKGRRPQHELTHVKSYYPALLAAANTLAFFEKYEAEIRALYEAKK